MASIIVLTWRGSRLIEDLFIGPSTGNMTFERIADIEGAVGVAKKIDGKEGLVVVGPEDVTATEIDPAGEDVGIRGVVCGCGGGPACASAEPVFVLGGQLSDNGTEWVDCGENVPWRHRQHRPGRRGQFSGPLQTVRSG